MNDVLLNVAVVALLALGVVIGLFSHPREVSDVEKALATLGAAMRKGGKPE